MVADLDQLENEFDDNSDGMDEEFGKFSDDFKIIHSCGGELKIETFYTEQSMADIDPMIIVMDCKKCGERIRARIWL